VGKRRMERLLLEGVEHQCKHEQLWPPIEVQAYGPTAEHVRYKVSNVRYQRVKTWEQVCGLHEMNSGKCPSCPHVVIDGVPATSAGIGGPTAHATTTVNPLRRKQRRQGGGSLFLGG